jgi:hypothetical protein
MPLSPCCFG